VPRVWVGRSFGRQKREHFSGGEVDYLFLLFVLSWQIVESFSLRETHIPHNATLRAEDLLCL